MAEIRSVRNWTSKILSLKILTADWHMYSKKLYTITDTLMHCAQDPLEHGYVYSHCVVIGFYIFIFVLSFIHNALLSPYNRMLDCDKISEYAEDDSLCSNIQIGTNTSYQSLVFSSWSPSFFLYFCIGDSEFILFLQVTRQPQHWSRCIKRCFVPVKQLITYKYKSLICLHITVTGYK